MWKKNIILPFLFAISSILLSSTNSFASHIFGGELLYKNISGNTYKVTLTLYGDCGADPAIFNSLDTAIAKIDLYNNSSFYTSVSLHPESVGVEVSPVCPNQLGNTTCSGLANPLPGVKRFIYSDTVVLPVTSGNWRFVFTGLLGNASSAGRSSRITNIIDPGNSIMQIDATLNNLNGPNNSPNYSTIPTPFYCVGIDEQYNQGAIDADGDSLAFSLVPGINANTAGPLSYMPPYTADAPLATAAGDFSFNTLNGQLAFKANGVQDALIVNQVSEYRHGVLVGTSKREMTFIVTGNCDGTPPSLHIANLVGGSLGNGNVIKMCSGTPQLAFNILLSNPDGDNTEITTSDLPPAAALSITDNNGPKPALSFSWNTDTLTTGVYTFFVYIQNNHCPISNHQTIAYTINVVPLVTLSETVLGPTGCIHQGFVQYNLSQGYLPRTITVKENGVVIKTYTDSTGVVRDSLYPGDYTIYASSNPVCEVFSPLSIVDSGVLPLDPYTLPLCKGDTQTVFEVPTPGQGTVTTWYDANGNLLPDAPTINTAAAGTFTWYVTEHYKVCTSDKAAAKVVVNPLPDLKITSRPDNICYGDTVYLEATGGTSYTWQPQDRINISYDGRVFTRLITGGTFTVKTTDDIGCTESSSIAYNSIQPCCNFFYPNAFTPNAETNNGFKVVTHGNMFDYMLAVYNRWGQLVYLSYDPQAYWNGKLYGTPCEPGTYFYYFKGRCLTGTTEEKKGDVTLIR